MNLLVDSYKRSFSYLRLSVLPVCNFKCAYCLPNGNPTEALHQKHLTQWEIKRLVKALAGLGIEKVRLTGGEPTLRSDLTEIASLISTIPGIQKVALTTNGYRLSEIAGHLKESGVTRLNVSVDSLIPKRFFEITGQDQLLNILKGIETARKVGFQKIKVNVVVMKDVNDSEYEDFILWSQKEDLDVRFIELMSTEDNVLFFKKRHLDLASMEAMLPQMGYSLAPREKDGGPASTWKKTNTQGSVGFIRAYKNGFCDTCNRLRVTSQGELQLCLFGSGNLALRQFLQEDGLEEQIQSEVRLALAGKAPSHFLREGSHGTTRNLAAMGG